MAALNETGRRIGYKVTGIWRRNAVLAMGMGLVPAIVLSTSLRSSVAISIIYAFLILPTYLFAAIVPLSFPRYVRIPIYAFVAALFFIPAYYLDVLLFPTLRDMLGITIYVGVADLIVIYRADSYARNNSALIAFVDGLVNIIGLSLVTCLVGACRELLGTGSIWGIKLTNFNARAVTMPLFGFIMLGFLGAFSHFIRQRSENKPRRTVRPAEMRHATIEEEKALLEEKVSQNRLAEKGEFSVPEGEAVPLGKGKEPLEVQQSLPVIKDGGKEQVETPPSPGEGAKEKPEQKDSAKTGEEEKQGKSQEVFGEKSSPPSGKARKKFTFQKKEKKQDGEENS